MKERPILFNAPMVRALLAGAKTQTRRVAKGLALEWLSEGFTPEFVADYQNRLCPYGQPGDRLWVRETWAQPTSLDPGPTFYRADYPSGVPRGFQNVPPASEITWKPSIHMPRALSRITLEIVSVRVERLQDISEVDAIAEGCVSSINLPGGRFANENYAWLWEQINGDGSWEANPWVWVVEFKRVEA
jgi:hypothetical protein